MNRRKQVGYFLQYLGLRLLLGLLGLLPFDAASGLGGRIGRAIGPRLRRHAIARANMQRALPELDAAAIDAALSEMWDNLGRTFAEYPHLATLYDAITVSGAETPESISATANRRIVVTGREHLDAALAAGRGAIVFGGHFANWELSVLLQSAAPVDSLAIYRHQNNPWIDRLLVRLRPSRDGKLAPKGAAGARDIVAMLRAGGIVGVLVDQKYNEGVAVPFFGHDAMTVNGPAELAIRRGVPMLGLRIERHDGTQFRVTVEPPLALPPKDSGAAGMQSLLEAVNATLERWIRERPGQWYWIHQRWPRDP
jgi:KDO2-lipid IV(A) lauroyltransferase